MKDYDRNIIGMMDCSFEKFTTTFCSLDHTKLDND